MKKLIIILCLLCLAVPVTAGRDVFTVPASASDGMLYDNDASSMEAACAAEGKSTNTNLDKLYIGERFLNNKYYIYRSFIRFDLSALEGTVVSDTLYIYVDWKGTEDCGAVELWKTTADWGTIDDADFSAAASLAGSVDYADITASTWMPIDDVNDTVESGEVAAFRMQTTDCDDGDLPTTSLRYIQLRSVDYTGTATDPYLAVNTTAGGVTVRHILGPMVDTKPVVNGLVRPNGDAE